jgi:hypothetical protein
MGRSKQTFKQSDVTRFIKGALAAGFEPKRIGMMMKASRPVFFLVSEDDEAVDQASEWDDWLEKDGDD